MENYLNRELTEEEAAWAEQAYSEILKFIEQGKLLPAAPKVGMPLFKLSDFITPHMVSVDEKGKFKWAIPNTENNVQELE